MTHTTRPSKGQTHVDYPQDEDNLVWAHPIDLQLSTDSPQGWPRILVRYVCCRRNILFAARFVPALTVFSSVVLHPLFWSALAGYTNWMPMEHAI